MSLCNEMNIFCSVQASHESTDSEYAGLQSDASSGRGILKSSPQRNVEEARGLRQELLQREKRRIMFDFDKNIEFASEVTQHIFSIAHSVRPSVTLFQIQAIILSVLAYLILIHFSRIV